MSIWPSLEYVFTFVTFKWWISYWKRPALTNPFQICWLCLRLTAPQTSREGILTLWGVALTTYLPRKGSQVGASEESCSINNYCPVWHYFFPDNWAPQRTSNTCINYIIMYCYKIFIISVSNSPKLRGTMARLYLQSSTPTSQELSSLYHSKLWVSHGHAVLRLIQTTWFLGS